MSTRTQDLIDKVSAMLDEAESVRLDVANVTRDEGLHLRGDTVGTIAAVESLLLDVSRQLRDLHQQSHRRAVAAFHEAASRA